MLPPDQRVTLRQMLDHAEKAVAVGGGRSRADLDADEIRALAVLRLLEVLGEAANRVPASVQQAHADLPWREMVSLRNFLIHAYDRIDLEVVVQTLNRDLPPLIAWLRAILAEDLT
jgi:uncharacterized protein with HEPN domain